MDDNDALRLAALLCSRLTHDLAGPVGAVTNGLDLVFGHGAGDAEALTRAAGAQLKNRLAFFRRAYGTGEGLSWDEARRISEAYLAGSHHRLIWSETPDGGSPLVRLVLNMILCAMDTTPAGGTLAVIPSREPEVSADGELEDLSIASTGNFYQELSPRQVQPVFTAHLAWSMGLDLDADATGARRIVWHAKAIKRDPI